MLLQDSRQTRKRRKIDEMISNTRTASGSQKNSEMERISSMAHSLHQTDKIALRRARPTCGLLGGKKQRKVGEERKGRGLRGKSETVLGGTVERARPDQSVSPIEKPSLGDPRW